MADLGPELRALREGLRSEHAASTPPPSLRRDIARSRRTRAGLWSAAAAVGIVAIAASALPALLAQDEPDPAATAALPAIDPPVYVDATVSFDEATDWLDDPASAGPPQCGTPMPQSLAARDGFSATHEIPTAVTMQRDAYRTIVEASVTIRYGRYDEFPVIVDPMTGLVGRDGLVVGWLPPSAQRGVNIFVRGYPSTQTWDGLGGIAIACRQSPDQPATQLEPGDYEVAWMTRVHSSETANAKADLAQRGFAIPPTAVLAAYREGSYECERLQGWSGTVPITCDPGAVPGTEIDLDAGRVTFPYDEDALGREVDVTLVSQTVPLTIAPAPSDPRDVIEAQNPPHEPGEPMQCGDSYGALDGSDLRLSLTVPFDDLEFGSTTEVEAWVQGFDWTQAAVTLPATAPLWITQREQRRAALNDGGSYGYTLHEVVGRVEVTLPERIAIDRYEGPTSVTIDVSAVQWCDGPPSVSAAALTYSILAPHTVELDDEARTFELVRID
ncbi:hypothetical protein [Demequina activiva]|uniref:Uncharacterized protein n=1 Tax=Demequina activiva TaxID=1582364 RepID=A0A919Q2T6_9MICO|nr:hypothetical protein [Demequina activiva]GIG53841.1 hypothetical protein Dac01nite_05930 [Demequina activiva]